MQLQKAMIAELDGDQEKDPFPVQFNPTSLKLTLTNQVEGGESQGKQVRQHIGASSTTLSLDLIFDTADEGTTENPISVRKKTKQLERFLIAKGKGKQEKAPPRIRFTWGDLTVEGLMDSLTIDFDHFAANGVPLRAKVPLSIKGQDRQKELKPASDSRSDAPAPGGASGGGLGGGAGVGLSGGIGFGVSAGIGLSASVGIGLGASASVGVALGGESAGEFAARVGMDPAAWRGLEIGGESSLSLSAGVEVGFDTNLSASSGLGVTVGIEAGTSSSIEASFGLEASPSLNAVSGVGVGAQLASGFALSSAGGVRAAIESVQSAKNQSAETQTRAAFKTPAKALPAASQPSAPAAITAAVATSATGAQPARAEQARPPLKQTGFPPVSAQEAAAPAPKPPRADPRSSSFGFGVPLRSTTGSAADMRAESIQGDVAIKPKTRSGDPPITNDPTTPGWVALPARDLGRRTDMGKLGSSHKCGCGCKH